MNIDPNVIPIDKKTASDMRARAQSIMGACTKVTLRYLPALLQRMLDNVDDTLFELAERSENNADQALYFDTMREIRLRREELAKCFNDNLQHSHEQFMSRPAATPAASQGESIRGGELSLLDENDLEESLAVTGIIDKVKNQNTRAIYALERRLAHLMPYRNIDIGTLPMGPEAICQTFRSTIARLDADIKIKIILYKLFDQCVMANIGPLYTEINDLLIAAGILPELRANVMQKPGGSHRIDTLNMEEEAAALFKDSLTPTEQSLDAGAGYRHNLMDATTLSTLQQLLAQQRTATPPAIPAVAAPPGQMPQNGGVTTSELVLALTALQQRTMPIGGTELQHLGSANIKAVLAQEIHTQHGYSTSALSDSTDGDVIDIVAMMFDFILEDRHLHTLAASLIARLQIPILKVALSDKDFFGNRQHPARRLLNDMARAAVGLDEDSRLETCPILAEIDRIARTILTEYTDDIAIFQTLLDEFNAFQTEQHSREEALASATCKEFETAAQAKRRTLDTIADHLHGKAVPFAVYELVAGPWKDVMTHTWLKAGETSPAWHKQLEFIDTLIWSVDPALTAADQPRFLRVIGELLDMLRDGLAQIDHPAVETERVLQALESLHLASLRNRQNDENTRKVRIIRGPAPETSTSADATPMENAAEIEDALAAIQEQMDSMCALESMLKEPIMVSDGIPGRMDEPDLGMDEDLEEIMLTDAINTTDEDEFTAMARHIEVGRWVLFTDEDGTTRRGKLTWKNDTFGYVFVDWKFKVIADLNLNEFAARLRSGHASFIDDMPIIERSLNTLISKLSGAKT